MPLNKTSENGICFEPSLSDSTVSEKQFHHFSDTGDASASPLPAPISTNFDDVSVFMDALGIGVPDQVPPSTLHGATLPGATPGEGGRSSVPSSPSASDVALVHRLLLPVLQVLLRPRFQGHATDDTPVSMGTNGVLRVNAPLWALAVTLATPAMAAPVHHGGIK
jgi:hypothetical protein